MKITTEEEAKKARGRLSGLTEIEKEVGLSIEQKFEKASINLALTNYGNKQFFECATKKCKKECKKCKEDDKPKFGPNAPEDSLLSEKNIALSLNKRTKDKYASDIQYVNSSRKMIFELFSTGQITLDAYAKRISILNDTQNNIHNKFIEDIKPLEKTIYGEYYLKDNGFDIGIKEVNESKGPNQDVCSEEYFDKQEKYAIGVDPYQIKYNDFQNQINKIAEQYGNSQLIWKIDEDENYYACRVDEKKCPLPKDFVNMQEIKIRTFESGASRNSEEGKIDYEGHLCPLVMQGYGKYMHKHRFLEDGTMRPSDNWQKGIPKDAYQKSMYRHFMDTELHHRGYPSEATESEEDALYGVIFNAMGKLHEILKEKAKLHAESKSDREA